MLFFAQNSSEVLRLPSHRKCSFAFVETEGPSISNAKEANSSVFEFDQGNILFVLSLVFAFLSYTFFETQKYLYSFKKTKNKPMVLK